MQYGVHFTGGKLQGMDATQCEELNRTLKDGAVYIIDVKEPKPRAIRTLSQNASIHLYCDLVADELNSAGLSMKTVMSEEVEHNWTMIKFKEVVWKTVQLALTEKESTTKLTTDEVNTIYQTIARHLAQTFGVTVPFPDRFTLMDGE